MTNTQYYTEHPGGRQEFADWLNWADANHIVGYGDVEAAESTVKWQTWVTPAYLRQFAELVEYAYGDLDHRGQPSGSVQLGFGYDEHGEILVLLARDAGSEGDTALVCATRVEREDDD